MLGEKIKALRKRRHLNQDKFAETIGISRQTLSRWERGEAVPDSGQLIQIANAFQVDVKFLLDDRISPEDIVETKDSKSIENDEIVEQLIRINDHLAEELARRRENIKRMTLIILIVILTLTILFVILIITNMPPAPYSVPEISVSYISNDEN